MTKLERFPRSITSREVVHGTCGTAFDIKYQTLCEVCNPLSTHAAIFCSACGTVQPPHMYEWSDTGENLQLFRERLRESMPLPIRHIDSNVTLYACMLSIALIGAFAVHFNSLPLAIVVIAIMVVYVTVVLVSQIWSMAANFNDAV